MTKIKATPCMESPAAVDGVDHSPATIGTRVRPCITRQGESGYELWAPQVPDAGTASHAEYPPRAPMTPGLGEASLDWVSDRHKNGLR